MSDPRWMTVRDAADLLGESGRNRVQRTRRRLLRVGAKLVSSGEGRSLRYLVKREDVERLVRPVAAPPPSKGVNLQELVEGIRRELEREFGERLDALREELLGEVASTQRACGALVRDTVATVVRTR